MPQMDIFWGGGILSPKWGAVTLRPQKAPPCTEARHTMYRSLRSVHPFLHRSTYYPIHRHPMFCNGPDTPLKVPVPTGASAPHLILIHRVSKNVPPLTSHSPDIHNPITTIFGRNVTEKVKNQTMLCFPTSPL